GFLDFAVLAKRGMDSMTRSLNRIGAQTKRITKHLNKSRPRMVAAVSASDERKLSIARDVATKLGHLVDDLERYQSEFRADTETMTTNFLERIKRYPATMDLAPTRELIVKLRDATGESRASIAGNRAAVVKLHEIGSDQYTNHVATRYATVLTDLTSDFDKTTRFTTDAL